MILVINAGDIWFCCIVRNEDEVDDSSIPPANFNADVVRCLWNTSSRDMSCVTEGSDVEGLHVSRRWNRVASVGYRGQPHIRRELDVTTS